MDEFGVTEGRRWRWVAPDARVSIGCWKWQRSRDGSVWPSHRSTRYRLSRKIERDATHLDGIRVMLGASRYKRYQIGGRRHSHDTVGSYSDRRQERRLQEDGRACAVL